MKMKDKDDYRQKVITSGISSQVRENLSFPE